jgi:hypothetical protein
LPFDQLTEDESLREANMKRHVAVLLLVLPLGIIALGCEPPAKVAKTNAGPPPPPLPPGAVPPAPPVAAEATPTPQPGGQAPLPVETKVGVFAGGLDDLARGPSHSQPVQSTTQPDDPNLERVKAGKGVGIKGRSLDEYEGVIVTPAKAYFSAKERIFYEIEFPANYRLWRVQEDRAPKDFEELKSKFLDPMGLTAKMPKLPDGHKYVWNSETEELEVERPRRKTE